MGHYKVSIFGFARQSSEDGTVSLLVGTMGYVPPEGPGPKQDVFAAGIIFLEMLAKRKFSDAVFFRQSIVGIFEVAEVSIGVETDAQLGKTVDLCHGMVRRYSYQRFTARHALAETKKLHRLLEPHLYTR